MISRKEYDVLTFLQGKPEIDEVVYGDEISSLLKERLIEPNIIRETYQQIIYHGFLITPKGFRAYEEYSEFQRKKKLDIEAIELAKDANQIAKQANNLSNAANNISIKSNCLSKIAIAISIFAVVAAIIDIIVNVCT